ncbi:MAG: histidine ammonia-lyase [Cytophagales bacterium]|nr:histidine ammonia-lyase [Cytophagales bacterium]
MASSTHNISNQPLTFEKIDEIITNNYKLKLSDQASGRIVKCRKYLENKIVTSSEAIYGINTGFGALQKKNISHDDLNKLQINLVQSHACGVGEEIPGEIVKLMLLFKIQSLSYGHSGILLKTVERLIDFYNHEIYPVIYEFGSLGASGDLAPLAHLALPLIGLGEVNYKNKKYTGLQIHEKLGWQPLHFQEKEGLALVNGTQFMIAYGVCCLLRSFRLSDTADTIGALSIDAFDCSISPLHELIHKIRPHNGQVKTAERCRKLLKGSEITKRPKKQVQDPYSFRCIPQVHGASKDTIEFVKNIFLTEINAVTDNPNIFPEEGLIISGGNFHGQPLALALDFLCIALAELGSISERRTYQLVSGSRGLPEFLVANPGLNSGLMMPQYTAASIVSQTKQLCTPASVDSIVTSNGQEDHVSMGANAATKCYKVVHNLEKILAIELLSASQALEFRRPLKTSPELEQIVKNFRKNVPFIENDRVLHYDIVKSVDFISLLKEPDR